MKGALRARDSIRLETVRGIRGALRNREIEIGAVLADDGILRVIRTLMKQRVDAIEQYQKAGREDLAAKRELSARSSRAIYRRRRTPPRPSGWSGRRSPGSKRRAPRTWVG